MSTPRQLLPQHADLIAASGVTSEVAAARGYWSATKKIELKRLGFGDAQCNVPALVLPVCNVHGEVSLHQIRPDAPRHDRRSGKPLKYETMAGAQMALDVPPLARPWLADPARPLFVTEGIRKADAAVSRGLGCVALLGVWNWRGSNEWGGKVALADWEYIALNERQVFIAFDSDVMTKPAVHQALGRLKPFLEGRKAEVNLIYLPAGDGGTKVGLDDFLAAGHDLNDLLALATPHLRSAPGETSTASQYEATPTGLVWHKPTRDGPMPTRLTNFTAQIVGEVAEDDGAEVRRTYELQARRGDRHARFSVPVSQFAGLGWVSEQLGAGALVYPGLAIKDHTRAAIQILSGEVPERRVYSHTGWRQIGDSWVYLHAGGAIGPLGPVAGVEVALSGPLSRYILPEPATGDTLVSHIRATLRLLNLAPPALMFPLLAAIGRAPLGSTDFSVHLVGPTMVGKSEVAALIQQHWGAEMIRERLPGSWLSTGNALEALAFQVKDAILTVDDFAPGGTQTDVQRLHREAGRLLRAQGNSAGRQRMRADGTLRPDKPPRGLILSSGEDVPSGQSIRARTLILEVSPDAVNFGRLSDCQQDAAAGLYAGTMAGYIGWLAGRYDTIRASLRSEMADLRTATRAADHRRRTASIVADLGIGLRYLLTFAQAAGAVTADEATALRERGWWAISNAAAAQADHQAASEPTRRYLDLLSAALASGEAHLASPGGDEPASAQSWGWRERTIGTGENERNEWHPQGRRIGWIEDEDVYLEPEAAFAAAQRLGRDTGDGLAVTSKTLHKRLHERGLLASVDSTRRKLTVRRQVEGKRTNVLHLRASAFEVPEPAQSAQSDRAGDAPHEPGTSWADFRGRFWNPDEIIGPQNRPTDGPATHANGGNGTTGPIGPILEADTQECRADSAGSVPADLWREVFAPSPRATEPSPAICGLDGCRRAAGRWGLCHIHVRPRDEWASAETADGSDSPSPAPVVERF